MSSLNSSYTKYRPTSKADAAAMRAHRKRIRQDARFHTAMELVRSYGRIALHVLDDKWTAECRRMSE